LDLFIERGFDGTSIEQVARRAGVARLTVYRRWPSKEALLAQAIESARRQIPDAVSPTSTDPPLKQLIETLMPQWVEALVNPRLRALTARLVGSSTSHPSLLATYWEHYMVPRRQLACATLEQAVAEGMLAQDTDIDVLIDMMAGAVMYRALLQPGPPDEAELRRYLESVIRQSGLRSA
jgi:AcrR family transcriptional regulator